MNNKKVLITIVAISTILLTSITIGIILITSKGNIFKIAYNQNNLENLEQQDNMTDKLEENQNLVNTQIPQDSENANNDINKNSEEIKIQNIQEARAEAVNENRIINTVSSRSQVVREKANTIQVQITENKQQDYEEIKTYTKLEDVKISFNMDVSKTTGLSKEDFIKLVTNMKYDRTGILEKNAGWIWECCQRYSVNEIFVLGICGIESGWCSAPQHQKTHNYSSLMKGGKLIQYATDAQGFEAMIKLLGQKYLKPGGGLYHGATITGVGTSYCNPTKWPGKVYKCMTQVFQ